MRYIVVSGGVLSGLGKGVTASSIGVLMKACGLRVTSIKIDPYLNSDAGTMSPFEHGEVFVLDDGGEVDLDLGNYERFLDLNLGRDNNLTTGKVYSKVIEAERRGDYLGKTVQVIPHITDAVMDWIETVAHQCSDDSGLEPEVCIIELGGTVGDIESAPYVEALRQFQFRVGRNNVTFVHVSLVPVMGPVGEQKTKPTQHTVKELMGLGITPDILVCRSSAPLNPETRAKLAAFCHVPEEAVISTHDVPNIYHVPLMLEAQGLCATLGLKVQPNGLLDDWRRMAHHLDALEENVTIAMVGKYTDLSDAYLSVIKALQHAAMAADRKLTIDWLEAGELEHGVPDDVHADAWKRLRAADGILVPGGFGHRGVEGKILAANYARTNGVPYFGICLGLQVAAIEFARNVLGMEGSTSTEFDEDCPNPAVIFMPEISTTHLGGTMRLGSRPTLFQVDDCKVKRLYGGLESVDERHRHRYEVNPELIERLEAAGLTFVGKDETGQRCEILELPDHPYFVAVQYHPEFKSRPGRPSPPFLGLILAASGQPLP
ncbi:MAG: CTP synthase (glutamine hydrolyzing) [Candidatus Thermoplasmatota archaeon]|nr:CTP synthetase [Euryarchaeota archaeon]MEC7111009.1 CTP synthase (glutamine hydrolyzing) [Candidatus Thermoplasmatota archaeon]MEC7151242.1 CTP synthase (glutamine hydrolyzing) [Candidatus Thermoplasmatota archaeon]MEC7279626.1 CTP synthase (glutamine hydrolyzing) [Candidatus Thermoplasmatota archaeon]MEC7722376.1 CTP synthase (glutamine hydrolyzing) [Candidatus Thermoplasmatota archaeon]